MLHFSETMNANLSQPNSIWFQSSRNLSASGLQYRLTGGIASVENSQRIVLELTDHDFNQLKSLPSLASGITNTYLRIDSSAFVDMSNNSVQPHPAFDAYQADVVHQDETSPVLQSCELNLESGVLVYTFDEIINVSSIRIREVFISSNRSGNRLFLTEANHTGRYEKNLSLSLSEHDLNRIKRNDQLAVRYQVKTTRSYLTSVHKFCLKSVLVLFLDTMTCQSRISSII